MELTHGNRKGITPVIAIVLLLLVTVGAVGVVYTQFQNIANEGNTEFNTDTRQTELTLESVSENSNNNDMMTLTWTNREDSIEINQSRSLQIRFVPEDGESGVLFSQVDGGNFNSLSVADASYPSGASSTPQTGCFNDATLTTEEEYLVQEGETVTCQTNVVFPGATEEVGIIVGLKGGEKEWRYNCAPATSSSQTC